MSCGEVIDAVGGTNVFWGKSTPCTTAAVETNAWSFISALYTTALNPMKQFLPIVHGPWIMEACARDVWGPIFTVVPARAWIITPS